MRAIYYCLEIDRLTGFRKVWYSKSLTDIKYYRNYFFKFFVYKQIYLKDERYVVESRVE